MTKLRPALLLAAALLTGVVAAGCQSTANSGTPNANSSSAAAEQAKQALAAAVAKNLTTSSKFTMTLSGAALGTGSGDNAINGAVDPTTHKGSITMAVSGINLEFRLLPDAMYLKFGGALPGLPEGWMKLDVNKLPASLKASLLAGSITGADRFAAAVQDIHKTGDKTYEGTLDLAKSTGGLGMTAQMLNQIPQSDRIVPFSATLDDQGRLAEMVVTTTIQGKESKTDIKYSDFGVPVTVEAPPASETTEAPELIYSAMSALG
jgi:hypothetical protein